MSHSKALTLSLGHLKYFWKTALSLASSSQSWNANYKWLFRVLLGVAFKSASYWAARYAENGELTRRRPVWDQEIVVITGGASGLGHSTIQLLLEKHPGVRIASLDIAPPPITADQNENVVYYQVNVVDEKAIKQAAEDIRKRWGDPTIIINNAGILRSKLLLELSTKEFQSTFDVNILSCFLMIKEFLPALVKRDHGHVVQIGSVGGFITVPGHVDYAMTKSALISLHEGLALELKYRYKAPHVKTTTFCPERIETPMGLAVGTKKGLEPNTVAEAIVHQLDSGLSGNLVFQPAAAGVLLPLLRWMPKWYYNFIVKVTRLNDQVTEETKENVRKGYRILVDELD